MSSNLVRHPCYKYLLSASTTQRIKSQFKQPFVRDEKDCAPYHFPRQDWCKPWPKCCQPLRLYDGGYCISDACVHLPGGFFSCLVPVQIRMRHHNSAHREIRAKVEGTRRRFVQNNYIWPYSSVCSNPWSPAQCANTMFSNSEAVAFFFKKKKQNSTILTLTSS